MSTLVRAGALASTLGLMAAVMITLVVGLTPLAVVGALGAAIPAGMIYALVSAETPASQ